MAILLLQSVGVVVLAAITWTRSRVLLLVAVPGLALLVLSWLVLLFGNAIAASQVASPGGAVWTDANMDEAAQLGGLAGLMFVLGSCLASVLTEKVTNPQSLADLRLDPAVGQQSWLLIPAIAFTAGYVLVYGPANLISRPSYGVTFNIPALASVAGLLIPAGVVFAALVAVNSRGAARTFAVFLIAAQTALLFSTASRMLAVLPILVITVALVSGARVRPVHGVLAGAAALTGSIFALQTRSSPLGHGFFAYLREIATIRPHSLWDSIVESFSNVMFSIPLAQWVEKNGDVTPSDFAISASPSLADDAGWSALADKLRVHLFIPYNGLGELASLSVIAMAVGCVLLAFGTGLAVASYSKGGRRVLVLLTLALYFLTFLLLLEYNLRSSFRIVYAGIALWLVSIAFRRSNGSVARARGLYERGSERAIMAAPSTKTTSFRRR